MEALTIPVMKERMRKAYADGTLLAQSNTAMGEDGYWYHPTPEQEAKYGFSACAVGACFSREELPDNLRDHPNYTLYDSNTADETFQKRFFATDAAFEFASEAQIRHDCWCSARRDDIVSEKALRDSEAYFLEFIK